MNTESRFYIVEGRDINPILVDTPRSPKEYWAKTIPGFVEVNLWEITRPQGSLGGDFDLELFWKWVHRLELNSNEICGPPSEQEWAERPEGVISFWQSTMDLVQRR